MKRKQFATTILLGLFCVFLSGCVGLHYSVSVSGFNDPTFTGGRTYWLLSGKKDVTTDDLEFREFASYLRSGLNQAGFMEAPGFDRADLAVFISYGSGNAKEHNYSYSLPIYGQTGGGTYNFSGTTFSGSSTATTYGTIQQQPQYGVVGSQQISGTEINYLRYLVVDVLDAKKFQLEKKVVPVWKTEVSSWGRVDDIRYAMPPLVVAATPYFGKNTKQRLFFNINVGDKRLQLLRSRENK